MSAFSDRLTWSTFRVPPHQPNPKERNVYIGIGTLILIIILVIILT